MSGGCCGGIDSRYDRVLTASVFLEAGRAWNISTRASSAISGSFCMKQFNIILQSFITVNSQLSSDKTGLGVVVNWIYSTLKLTQKKELTN